MHRHGKEGVRYNQLPYRSHSQAHDSIKVGAVQIWWCCCCSDTEAFVTYSKIRNRQKTSSGPNDTLVVLKQNELKCFQDFFFNYHTRCSPMLSGSLYLMPSQWLPRISSKHFIAFYFMVKRNLGLKTTTQAHYFSSEEKKWILMLLPTKSHKTYIIEQTILHYPTFNRKTSKWHLVWSTAEEKSGSVLEY